MAYINVNKLKPGILKYLQQTYGHVCSSWNSFYFW